MSKDRVVHIYQKHGSEGDSLDVALQERGIEPIRYDEDEFISLVEDFSCKASGQGVALITGDVSHSDSYFFQSVAEHVIRPSLTVLCLLV